MPADVIQVQYDTLQEIASIWGRAQDRHIQTKQALVQCVDQLRNGGWEGLGAAAFFAEMDEDVFPALERLVQALGEAQRVTTQIITIFREAEEEAARPFRELAINWTRPRTSAPGVSTPTQRPGWWDRLLEVGEKIADWVDKVDTWLPAVALPFVLVGLKEGIRYPGQIIVDLPDWLGPARRWLRGMVNMSEHLTHIKGSNMARHIAGQVDIGPLDLALFGIEGALDTYYSWQRHAEEYASYHDPTRELSARIVDGMIAFMPATGELFGGFLGWKGGRWLVALLEDSSPARLAQLWARSSAASPVVFLEGGLAMRAAKTWAIS